MKLNLGKSSIILISMISLLLTVSLLIFFIVGNNSDRRVLFFPGREDYSGEVRMVPHKNSSEDSIQVFVKELILGPYSIDHFRIIPPKTKLQSLLLRNRTKLYIDFSSDFIVFNDDFRMVPSEMTVLIKKNLKYNFPFLKEITFYVDGQALQ